MINRNILKNALISRGICEDNYYLECYLDLLEENASNSVGEKHHAIPLNCYPESRTRLTSNRRYREKLAELDEANCLVMLTRYPDHYLAHAYFMLCCREDLISSNDIIPLKYTDITSCPTSTDDHLYIALNYINKVKGANCD